jgi:hypothetical protein
MFGDNQSVITSGTNSHSSLNKCLNALAYHPVHEAIASDVIWCGQPLQVKTHPVPLLAWATHSCIK